MRYALTGATGFVGGALARLLRWRGHEVTALVRRPDAATALAGHGVRLVQGDLDDRSALSSLLDGADGAFHVAGWYKLGERDPSQGWRVNVDGTRAVLEAARAAGSPRLVYTSTLAVNSDTGGRLVDETYTFTGRHLSVYDETKAEAHHEVAVAASTGLDVVTVMPGLVYGPGDTSQAGHLLAEVVAGGRPLVPRGGEVCWAHVDDVAEGHLLAMERGRSGESYMLAGPRSSLADGLVRAARLAGTPGPRLLPAGAVRLSARVAGAVGRLVPLPPTYAAETMRSSLATYLGDPAKAGRELGWHARSLDDGLGELVEGLRTTAR